MSFYLSFLEPYWLAGLVLLPLAVFVARHSLAALPPLRRRLALATRLVIIALLVLALAEPRVMHRSDALCVLFVIDQSLSVPQGDRNDVTSGDALRSQAAALRYLAERTAPGEMGPDDRAGLIVFGGDAQIEISPSPEIHVDRIESLIDREHTDVAQALRLAVAAFPDGVMKRVVLLTDGNENEGLAADQAGLLASAGVDLVAVPIDYLYDREVLVDRVVAPSEVEVGEPFVVRTVIDATDAGPATLRVNMNGQLIYSQEVMLRAGRNVIPIQREIEVPDFYEIEATIETPEGADSPRPNNRAFAFTSVRGESRVLYVTGSETAGRAIPAALQRERIAVDVRPVEQVSFAPARLQSYDLIVLDDVSAGQLSAQSMAWIEAVVRDTGIGLVMVGGPQAFGAGGYEGTPVERALPVDMELRERRVMPNGSLVLILHTCEFDQGNMWAKEISMAAIRVLSARDEAGILYWDFQGSDQWLFPLQPVGDKSRLYNLIRGCSPQDMPDFEPTMQLAHDALVETESTQKHCIIISDGDPQPPPESLLQSYADHGITVSTIAISPHGGGGPWGDGTFTLRHIAEVTHGRFYLVDDPRHLPQIFIKEASVVRRSLLVEGNFLPDLSYMTEIVRGVDPASLPPIRGYVATEPKPLAEIPIRAPPTEDGVRDPILAHWRYGLGRTVAFTSDGGPRWDPDWIAWGGFDAFFGQVCRWASRPTSAGNLQLTSRVEGDEVVFSVDAVSSQGEFENFLSFQGRATTPDAEGHEVSVVQTGPGHYEGRFPASEAGTYILSLAYTDPEGRQGTYSTGIAVPYSAEYRTRRGDLARVQAIARAAGGRVASPSDGVFAHDLETQPVPHDTWPWLAVAALLLLPLDVFLRRVMIDWARVRERIVGPIAAIFRRRPAETTEQAMARLLEAKEKVRETRTSGRAARAEEPGAPGAAPKKFEARTAEGAAAAAAAAASAATGPAPAAPAAEKKEAKPAAAAPEGGAGEDAYTSRLLRAKRRALEDRKRGGSQS